MRAGILWIIHFKEIWYAEGRRPRPYVLTLSVVSFHFKKVRLTPFPNNKNIEKIMKQIEIARAKEGDINRTQNKKKRKENTESRRKEK